MSSPPAEENSTFQPGQLGIRHLLGAMAVAAIVLGVSAARLRTLTAIEAAQVGYHWLYVLLVGVGGYFLYSLWRRKAGAVWLCVQQQPVSHKRRQVMRWLLTAAVVADGIFISFAVGPGATIWDALLKSPIMPLFVHMPLMEGWLWLACVRMWLSNPYSVEFREQGILTLNGYYPWKSIRHLGWSGIYPNNLAFVFDRHIAGLTIEPTAYAAVDDLLRRLRRDPNTAGIFSGG